MANHHELPFEEAIEAHLLGHGWMKGSPEEFDSEIAIDRGHLVAFIADTQPGVWAELVKQHGATVEKTVIEWLTKALDTQGALDVLRHGFKFLGKLIRVAYFAPAHSL